MDAWDFTKDKPPKSGKAKKLWDWFSKYVGTPDSLYIKTLINMHGNRPYCIDFDGATFIFNDVDYVCKQSGELLAEGWKYHKNSRGEIKVDKVYNRDVL